MLKQTNKEWQCAATAKLSTAPIPVDFPADILIKVHLPGEQRTAKTLHCQGDQTLLDVMNQVAKKSQVTREGELNPDDYVFKITGKERYIVDLNRRLHQIDHIRECLKRRVKISFSLAWRKSIRLEDESDNLAAKVFFLVHSFVFLLFSANSPSVLRQQVLLASPMRMITWKTGSRCKYEEKLFLGVSFS